MSDDTFRTVIASTPLVSIDLVVQNQQGEVLLGQRLNRPAQGGWFVPGGRILKNESLDGAFRRLAQGELGHVFERNQARLLDVYEHFYQDSVYGEGGSAPDTHYVVLGYRLLLPKGFTLTPPTDQHGHFRWWNISEVKASTEVHANTRAYLQALL
ncbi:NUDIX hydrolase [Stutzerimonas stutzeri ATCC 14405 = CCUG 16156]|nr:NUDIX hydrolase [Stutzerimonas stutzeri ATCC 14405 = CCUG 16156]